MILIVLTYKCVFVFCQKRCFSILGGIPEKVFTRHQRLMFTEIVGYKVDEDLKWFALTGLAPQVK